MIEHLLNRVAQVQREMGAEPTKPLGAAVPFAELLDSMALVEFLAVLAEDCGVEPEAIDGAAQHRFTTVADLAEAMVRAGMSVRATASSPAQVSPGPGADRRALATSACWLAATAVRLPDTVQAAEWIDEVLDRPRGWLESHAGIRTRRVWQDQDPLAAAAEAGSDCLQRAGFTPNEIGALLVTSEAPPLLAGLAADLHHRLSLSSNAAAVEIGGACTGFLVALWTAQALVPRVGPVLIVAVEAPSRFLSLEPGQAGEHAALFGDGAAAALLCAQPQGTGAVCLAEVTMGVHGGAGDCLRVERADGAVMVRMDGRALAGRAIRMMAQALGPMLYRHGLAISDLRGVVAHAGNGRMAALLARQLRLPSERVWSATATTGNLGAASLPVAWHGQQSSSSGPVAWVAVGAGLTWGAALTNSPPTNPC
jgi:3-oxoacyl-[acyl-carrier-protein] synthase-3